MRVNTAGRDSERNIDELILGDTREQMLLKLKDTRITIISIGLKVASGSLYLPWQFQRQSRSVSRAKKRTKFRAAVLNLMNDSFERSPPPPRTCFEPTLSHLGLKTNPNLSPLDVSMASTEECFEEDSIQSALSSFHTSLKTLTARRPSQLDRERRKRRGRGGGSCLLALS